MKPGHGSQDPSQHYRSAGNVPNRWGLMGKDGRRIIEYEWTFSYFRAGAARQDGNRTAPIKQNREYRGEFALSTSANTFSLVAISSRGVGSRLSARPAAASSRAPACSRLGVA